MKSLLAASAIAAGLLFAQPALANLVLDPGFETPVVPVGGFTTFNTGTALGSWTVVGAAGNVAPVSGTFQQNGFSFVAQEGAQWLDLTGLNSNSATGVQQTIATTPGTSYDLSFWVGNVVNTGGIFGTTSTVNVLVNGSQVFSANNSGGVGSSSQTWQQFTTSFVAGGASTNLAFLNGDPGTDNDNGLDGVNLVVGGTAVVPEPSAWALLIAGFGGMGLVLRRARSQRRLAV